MGDGHLGNLQATAHALGQDLGVDACPGRGQSQPIDDLAAKYLERAVQIANLHSQDEANESVSGPGVEQSVLGIGPFVAITDGQVAGFQPRQEIGQIEEAELSVGVRKHDQIAARADRRPLVTAAP